MLSIKDFRQLVTAHLPLKVFQRYKYLFTLLLDLIAFYAHIIEFFLFDQRAQYVFLLKTLQHLNDSLLLLILTILNRSSQQFLRRHCLGELAHNKLLLLLSHHVFVCERSKKLTFSADLSLKKH